MFPKLRSRVRAPFPAPFHPFEAQCCGTRVHAETGQMPIERFTSAGPLHAAEPSLLREAFRWSVVRRVTHTASVSVAGIAMPSIRRWSAVASSCASIPRT